jgi:taurine dioxygenase
VHPVVRTHPESGRKALFVNAGFTTHIVGMASDESDDLLQTLFEASTQPDNIYVHVWQPDDVVCWDNRCAMHHATPFDTKYTRHMHRTTVRGDAPIP